MLLEFHRPVRMEQLPLLVDATLFDLFLKQQRPTVLLRESLQPLQGPWRDAAANGYRYVDR